MADHENVAFIEQLFYRQIKDLTLRTRADAFDLQHSDAWL